MASKYLQPRSNGWHPAIPKIFYRSAWHPDLIEWATPHPSSQRHRHTSGKRDEHLVSISLLSTELPLDHERVETPTWTHACPACICMTAIPSPENGKQASMRLVEISTSNGHAASRMDLPEADFHLDLLD